MQSKVIFTIICLIFCSISKAQTITIDGKLDEPEWQNNVSDLKFTTVKPFSLEAAEYLTEVRIFTDESGIYFAITNFQEKSTQQSERTARDGYMRTDYNTIVIDFDNTALSAYSFQISNAGSIEDGIWRNENEYSTEWNGVWTAETSVDEEHWYTEVHIPWDVAPMVLAEGDNRKIGLYVSRYVSHLSKTYASAAVESDRQRFLSDFPDITINDHASSSFQIFASATTRKDIVANENSFDVGLDIFWKPDSNKQLSLAINPDFGHVDSDQLVVNFSPTETFFNENRPFFTENQALFDVRGAESLRMVHTRRIGGAPDIGDEIESDIKAAVKFTSVGDDFNYGLFSAIEDDNSLADGRNYYVARIVRKTDEYSLGYLLSYTDRPDIARKATVQAVDYNYYFSKELQLNTQVFNTNIDSITQNYSDSAGSVKLEHQLDERWSQSLEMSYFGDQFDVNDLGYLPRNNIKTLEYINSWSNNTFTSDSIFQNHESEITFNYQENNTGDRLNSSIKFYDRWYLKDTAFGNWSVELFSKGYDDLITRGNRKLLTDSKYYIDLLFFNDQRGKIRNHTHFIFHDQTVRGKGYIAHIHPSYHFNDQFSTRLGIFYYQSDDWLVWQESNQINGYRQKKLRTLIDFDGNIDDKQELTLRFQWIALSAQGQNTYTVSPSGQLINNDADVEDFSISDTAIQLRYRYEIAPLSNLYLVYSRGGTTYLDEELPINSLFSPGWDEPDGNNIILKIRYQF